MSNQTRRWWIGIALTACMAVVPSVFGVAGPPPGSATPAAIAKWVQNEADLLDTPGITAEAAAGIRDELTAAFSSGKTVPSAYRQEMATACSKYLGPIILRPKGPQSAINALIVLYIVDHFNTDGVFRDALLNKTSSAAVRYWAAKGLAHIIPQFLSFKLNTADIFDEVTRKNGYLPVEKDPLVRAELANVVGAIGDPVTNVVGLAALTQAMVMTNKELATVPVTRAYTDCAATIMDNMAKIIPLGAKPVPDAIQSASEELKTAAQHVKTHNDKSPADPAVLEGLRLQYKSFEALIKATPGTKTVVLPAEPAGNMDPVKDPPKLFKAIEDALVSVTKVLGLKPPLP